MEYPLVTEIKNQLKTEKVLSFDKFVKLALYHPKYGYYTRKRVAPRPGEDFFTAPELTPIFGKVVANFLRKAGFKGKILELGGGKGFLAKDLIEELKPKEYFFLEKIPPKLVKEKVRWIKSLKEIPKTTVTVVANEFFDAFPFKRIKKVNGELKEVGITEVRGKLTEVLIPYKKELPCTPDEGKEYPLFVGWESFLNELTSRTNVDLIVIFDYGGKCEEVASKISFRAYRNGKLVNDYLEKVGFTDLTADVDFSRLSELLKELGFKVSYQPLSSFLLENGIEKFSLPYEIPQVLTLLLEMGRRFKVLIGKSTSIPI